MPGLGLVGLDVLELEDGSKGYQLVTKLTVKAESMVEEFFAEGFFWL